MLAKLAVNSSDAPVTPGDDPPKDNAAEKLEPAPDWYATADDKLNYILNCNRGVERYVDPRQPGWKQRFYSVFGGGLPVKDLANKYKDTMNEVYRYYREGLKMEKESHTILLETLILDMEYKIDIKQNTMINGYKSKYWN